MWGNVDSYTVDKNVYDIAEEYNDRYVDCKNDYDWWYIRFMYMHNRVESRENYKNVSICQNWNSFDIFYNDVQSIQNSHMEGWQMDKDLLSINGCKMYSKDTVCFLPKSLNMLITSRMSLVRRGILRGVHTLNGKFYCEATIEGKTERFYYNTEIEAFMKYRYMHNKRINNIIDNLNIQLPNIVESKLRGYYVGFDS